MITVIVDKGKRKMGVEKSNEDLRRKGKHKIRKWREKEEGRNSCVQKAKGGFDSLLLTEP